MTDEREAWISIWARGHAKSTLAELGTVYLGAKGTVDSEQHRQLESDPVLWLYTLFPEYMGITSHGKPVPLAQHHKDFLAWLKEQPRRRYGLYISDTQDQADDHVANISQMLTSPRFARWYPKMAARKMNKFGSAAGWRRNRLRTAAGFTIDAAGLEQGLRGAKMDEMRPDLMVLDDLDRENDSPTVTDRKVKNLTRAILPAKAVDCTIMGVQNLILRGGIFDQLATGTADFLTRRRVSGPHPALRGFDHERDLQGQPDGTWKVVGGEPTWGGMDRQACENLINDIGVAAFLTECQHNLRAVSDLVFPEFDPEVHEYRYKDLPEFVAYFGGEDFGGEGLTAHYSALTLLGLTRNGRLILLEEWYANGANVAERQQAVKVEWGQQYGHIRWCQDGDERTVFQFNRTLGFDVRMSKRGSGAVESRVRTMGRKLALDGSKRPGFFYLRKCSRFAQEIQKWRRRPPKVPTEPAKREILSVDDDVLVSCLYAMERAEQEMGTLIEQSTTLVLA